MADGLFTLIPAKGHSRRLPGKNKRLLAGKPLVAYSIEMALQCRLTPYVSTEDPQIALIAAHYNVHVIQRPAVLAQDATPSADVVAHALEAVGPQADAVVLLQPTSPLRKARHIKEGIDLYRQNKYGSVISVCESTSGKNGSTYAMKNGMMTATSESNSTNVTPNGALYVFDAMRFEKEHSIYLDPCGAYLMAAAESVDIDTEADFLAAEALLDGKA